MSDLTALLKAAKLRLSEAAARCLNDPSDEAAAEADSALAEVASLQALLKAQRSNTCAHPTCERLTLQTYCEQHRPPDIWDESRRTLDELRGRDE